MPTFKGQHADTVRLSDDQFDELKALLAPGAELAALMLADYKARQTDPIEPTKTGPSPESEPEPQEPNPGDD